MTIFGNLGQWDNYDEQEPESNFEFFDRVIATTVKAILYGYNNTQFWLPKSVHSVIRTPTDGQGEVMIEGWADYHVTSVEKTDTKSRETLTAEEAASILHIFKD